VTIEVVDFRPAHVDDAASLAGIVDGAERFARVGGVAAFEAGELVGFLVAFAPLPRFRRTERTGAHVPEWGHGVRHAQPARVYRAMYGAMAVSWAAMGCSVHTITVLAGDRPTIDAWFEMGFGMLLVDAVIDADALRVAAPPDESVRRARTADAELLAGLDAEHVAQYAQPPTSMVPPTAWTTQAWHRFLDGGRHGAWIAEVGREAAGFVRFVDEHGGSDATADPNGAFIDGLYVRPRARGRGIALALVSTGSIALAEDGIRHIALDYESTNPTAAAFWPTCSTAVAFSLMRVIEA
jgi:ribosomal protein S18 acetylase RimI-like enzyme